MDQLTRLVRRIEAIRAEFDEQQDDANLTQKLDDEAPYVEREESSAEADGVTFALYEEVTLARPKHITVDLHETPQGILTQLVVDAVRVEGPVHRDHVTTKIREAWGLKRAGSRIEDAVAQSIDIAVKTERVALSGEFLSAPGQRPSPRDRSNVVAIALRKAEMLPPDEIEAAVRQLIQRSLGATRDQVIQAVSRGFGIRSTSSQIRGTIEQAVDMMITRRQLKEVAGLLTMIDA